MTFEELWVFIVSKNKSLSNSSERITLTKDAFKKALKLSFDQGINFQKDSEKNPYLNQQGKDLFNNLFGGIIK